MWQVVTIVSTVLFALIAVIYGILNYEIRKLRNDRHEHANRITEHEMWLSVIRKKLDL